MTRQRKNGSVLVVGAGIGGIRSALDLAEFGYGVTLIDKAPHLGGVLTQLDHQFPSNHCGICKLLPMVDREAVSESCIRRGLSHENITLRLNTTLAQITGDSGDYQITLRQPSPRVAPDKCHGCGLCEEACPVVVPDAFNVGLTTRKAVYRPTPYTDPPTYQIDIQACTRCGACEKICPMEAIQLTPAERKQFHVLVVDDELVVRDSLKEWLLDEGFSVDMAASGPEALEKITGHTYHLMLLDIKMPGMDGVTVLTKAKEIVPELSVVMMTAYATVDTAVAAMKTGAMDYLLKPFEPEVLIPKVIDLYEVLRSGDENQLSAQAVILAGGVDYYDPSSGKNTFSLGASPHVMTHLAFERLLSGTGPTQGRLVRPSDGKPVKKIFWIQCVGSRDIQENADFCSSICCMTAIKEAVLAKAASAEPIDTTIFYMDMRTVGKSFQRYREHAETQIGVRMVRARVHSVNPDLDGEQLSLRYVDLSGNCCREKADLVVLSLGQRPSAACRELAEMLEFELDALGFPVAQPFSQTATTVEGVFMAGSFGGLRDISESVIQSSAAALEASRVIHKSGGGLQPEISASGSHRNVDHEMPRILVLVDAGSGQLTDPAQQDRLSDDLKKDPHVHTVVFSDQMDTLDGMMTVLAEVVSTDVNRLLIGTRLASPSEEILRQIANQVDLAMHYIHVVQLRPVTTTRSDQDERAGIEEFHREYFAFQSGIVNLKHAASHDLGQLKVQPRALIVGGGIAGLTAGLGIADHGFDVDVVELKDRFGGHLEWIPQSLSKDSPREFLEDMVTKAEQHPHVHLYRNTRVAHIKGDFGQFTADLETENESPQRVEYGAVILATGGREAQTESYGFGRHPSIVTQKTFSAQLYEEESALSAVVMIQCVDSREEPRNYCSRVCCQTTLRQALQLKEKNPDSDVYVLYRDMMSYGNSEKYYTRARNKGVIFIQYTLDQKPEVVFSESPESSLRVRTFEPIIGRHIEIETDRVVLATGMVPTLPAELADNLSVTRDSDGFFQEAEYKWRPVESLRTGVFGCGISRAPCTIPEAITSAKAAAMGALRVLSQNRLTFPRNIARVRINLCSLCERCIEVCPYGARSLDPVLEQIAVNPALCQGCGACTAACPNDASVLDGHLPEQMFEMIDAVLERPTDR